MGAETSQAGEDFTFTRIVGFQFDSIAFRYGQREFQRIDRIESEAFDEKRLPWRYRVRGDFELQGFYDEARHLLLDRVLRRGVSGFCLDHGIYKCHSGMLDTLGTRPR